VLAAGDEKSRMRTRCACGIDIHAHVVPATFPAYLHGAPPAGWPSTPPRMSATGTS
jgi:aminocarboxymuconate-semialdehyde decarboxylase